MLLELGLGFITFVALNMPVTGVTNLKKLMITGVLEAKYLSQFMAKTLSEMNGVDVAAIKRKS